jgi:ribosomal protein S18 acetylase RimI-like enzyme
VIAKTINRQDRGGNVTLRRGAPADIGGVLKLAEVASGCAQWTAAAYLPYCQPPPGESAGQTKILFVAAVAEETPSSRQTPVESSADHVVGFAAFSALPDVGDCELDNIAVDPGWRRRGIGRRLLEEGLLWDAGLFSERLSPHRAASEDAPAMWLEVRAGNLAAIELYRSAGFQIAGVRHEYYSQPLEDAVRMRKPLIPSIE